MIPNAAWPNASNISMRIAQICATVLLLFCALQCNAQETAIVDLKGLKKAAPGDLPENKRIMLDGSTPVFDENGKKLSPAEMMKIIQGGKIKVDPYINEKKEIKAYVIRPMTDEEKSHTKAKPNPGSSSLVGTRVSAFSVLDSLIDLEGHRITLDRYKGKIVVINFWFVECEPCVEEMPGLNKLVETFRGKNVAFLAFTWNDPEALKAFLAKHPFGYTIVPNSQIVLDGFGISRFPTHMIIGADSKIDYLASGLDSESTVPKLQSEIERLLTPTR